MVIVDVEHRDRAQAERLRMPRRNRRVVEVAIAAEIVRARMVAGRTAQRERVARARGNLLERRERALRRPVGSVPCPLGDRGRRIEGIGAEQRVDPLQRQLAPSADRKGVADRITLPPRCAPLGVGLAQEGDVVGIVNREDRLEPEVAHRLRCAAAIEHRGQPPGGLGIGDPLAVMEFPRRRVARLPVVEEEPHRVVLPA